MRDRLFQLLGIEHEEESLVLMLLTQSIFLGIFFGAFDISAHSMFLSIFDEKVMARAYVVSGLAGILLTSLYTWFQARLSFKIFATSNLVVLAIITLILWITLLVYPTKVVIFSLFVMLGPLNILAMLSFWGTTGRLFTLRQGKRLFGLVDAGLIIGVIISCYAIPVLLSFQFESHNILLISVLSISLAALVQMAIGRKFTFITSEKEETGDKGGLSVFRNDSYVRIMGLFIALSVMTAFFVQYSFMAVTREQYPLEEDMARFLGLFTGSMMIFTLLIKVLVFSYLIRNYGLKTCLAITPILVAGFTVIAIIIGMSMGYTPASSAGFLIFFLLLALSRLFSKSLKDSIESPSFKVIYQTVDEKIRFNVQSGIDGTVNEISALGSGLLLAGLGALSFVRLIHFSWVLFGIIAIWIVVAFRLYQEYRRSIRKSLESADTSLTEQSGEPDYAALRNRIAGLILFRSEYYRLATGDLTVIDKNWNPWFLRQVIEYSESTNDICMLPSLKMIASDTGIDEGLRQRGAEVIDRMVEHRGDNGLISKTGERKQADEKIQKARLILSGSRLPQTTEILRLLRDKNPDSKRYALYMIGKFQMNDMIAEVCNCFNIPELENDVLAVLESFGTKAHEDLIRLYMGSSGSIKISRSVIRLLSKTCSDQTNEFLFARLWSNSRQIKELAATKLVECGFVSDSEGKDRLNQLISDILGMMTWNISARLCLARKNNQLLADAITKETESWNAFLFNLLSITYDPASVDKIRANLETGTVGSVNYALEMIDIVIDDAIKPKLVSYIDTVPDEEKLKNLHQFYPGEIPVYENLIEDLINRDYNLIGIWAKACALRTFDNLSDGAFLESAIALLFSPEKILQEEAARIVMQIKPELFKELKMRLPKGTRATLDPVFSGTKVHEDYLFEKVRFLSGLFIGIPENELVELAEALRYSSTYDQLKIDRSQDYVLWSTHTGYTGTRKFLLPDDKISEYDDILPASPEAFFFLLPVRSLEEFTKAYPESGYRICMYLDNNNITPG